jgi:hypothetical protein
MDARHKIRCESCGMPTGPGIYGTGADGTPNEEYCKLCYQNGAFTEPELTLDEMIKKSIHHMMIERKFEEEGAEVMARAVIPNLKRWRK